jgi:uncharacterized protein (DUF433 family)/DNA-binding transcriptional MerR regulator
MSVAFANNPQADSDRWLGRLGLPAYSVAEAARWAGVHPNTIRYWFYGRSGQGRGIVIPGKTRRRPLTYVQLTEVAFVATFRALGVPLKSIRRAHAYLCEALDTEHPFAEHRFQTEGAHVLLQLSELHPDLADVGEMIIADRAGQVAWKGMLAERFAEFDYEHGIATRWHVAGPDSSVVIDARIAFGTPTIKGIKTRAIGGRAKAGADDAALRRNFGLSAKEVHDALRFEGLSSAA